MTSYSTTDSLFERVAGDMTDFVTMNGGSNLTSVLASHAALIMGEGSFFSKATVLATAWVEPSSYRSVKMGNWDDDRVTWYGYGPADPQYYLLQFCHATVPARDHYFTFVEAFLLVIVACGVSLLVPEVQEAMSGQGGPSSSGLALDVSARLVPLVTGRSHLLACAIGVTGVVREQALYFGQAEAACWIMYYMSSPMHLALAPPLIFAIAKTARTKRGLATLVASWNPWKQTCGRWAKVAGEGRPGDDDVGEPRSGGGTTLRQSHSDAARPVRFLLTPLFVCTAVIMSPAALIMLPAVLVLCMSLGALSLVAAGCVTGPAWSVGVSRNRLLLVARGTLAGAVPIASSILSLALAHVYVLWPSVDKPTGWRSSARVVLEAALYAWDIREVNFDAWDIREVNFGDLTVILSILLSFGAALVDAVNELAVFPALLRAEPINVHAAPVKAIPDSRGLVGDAREEEKEDVRGTEEAKLGNSHEAEALEAQLRALAETEAQAKRDWSPAANQQKGEFPDGRETAASSDESSSDSDSERQTLVVAKILDLEKKIVALEAVSPLRGDDDAANADLVKSSQGTAKVVPAVAPAKEEPAGVDGDAGGDEDCSHSTGAELRQAEDVSYALRRGFDDGHGKGNEQGAARSPGSDDKPTTFGASKGRHSSDMKMPRDHVPARSIAASASEVSRANNAYMYPGPSHSSV